MNRLIYLLVAALSFTTLAHCEEQEPAQEAQKPIQTEVDPSLIPSLVNLTSMPTAIVNGSVNVITGDLCEYDEEDMLFATDPYVLGHTYFSSSLERGSLGDGWNFLHHQLLSVYQPNEISYTKSPFETTYHLLPLQGLIEKDAFRDVRDRRNNQGHNENRVDGPPPQKTAPLFLTLYDPSGGSLLFKAKYDEMHKEKSLRHFKLVSELTGYTNVVGGKMSGQTNIKNIQMRWDKASDSFYVTHGDGTKRTYVRRAAKKEMERKEPHRADNYRDYILDTEIKPNGNVVSYNYNDKHEIVKVRGMNRNKTKELYWVDFDQRTTGDFAKNPTLDIRTSDNRQHTYYFQKLKGSYMKGTYSVSHIRRQGLPFTNYLYSEKSSRHDKRIIKKETEGGFYVSSKYYRPSDNWMDSRTVKPKNKKESKFLRNRVRMQSSPIGPNGEEVITHRYFYYQDEGDAGHCTVRDVYNNIHRYFWDKDKRLIRVTKCDSSDNMLMSERYYWGKNDSKDEGRLLCRILKDEKNRPVLANSYKYDSRGNVVEETLYGRITENSGELTLKNGMPHKESCDKQTTRYTYTKDGFNLVESSCDPLGNYTYYEYVKNTNLLRAKFICDKKKIKKREFFGYDSSGIVIEHIVDDGSTKDKNNLTDATERHITRTKVRQVQPKLGEPEEIMELFYNFAENKEAFLKKTVNHFNDKGFVAKQEHVDQLGGRLFYEYEYDDVGRVIYSKNPLGHTEQTEYDIHGRIIKKTGPRDDVTLLYQYDLAGRCIAATEKHASGLELTERYEYDLLGRKITLIDAQNCTTRYEYDALNRITAITYPAIFDHKNRKIVPQKRYSYTHLGSYVTETDENGLVTITKHNALGKVCEKIFPDKSKTLSYYDIVGNPVKEVAQNGAVNRIEYDAFGRVLKSRLLMDDTLIAEKEVIYNSFHPIVEIGFTGEKTAYSYDYAGRKSSIELQDKRITKFVYDARGRLYRQRSFLADGGFVGKRFKYDDLNRVVYESTRDHKKRVRTYKEFEYDCDGNIVTQRQKVGRKITASRSSYLPGGLIESQTDALGNVTSYSYDYSYKNNYGQKVLRTIAIDARGKRSEQIFDTRGNLSVALSYDPNKTLIAKKELFYDAANNLLRTKEYAITADKEPKKITTTFTYADGHLTSITEARNTPEQKVTQFAYNEFGQKKSATFQDGTILRYRYDAKGRVERFFAADKSIDYRYSYDASDRILSLTNAVTGKTTQRSYNAFGELETETLETGFSLHYGYDDIGRLQSLSLPDGSNVLYERSCFLEKIIRHDADGQELYSHTIDTRDKSGLVNKVTLANGSQIRTSHDLMGRCKKIAHPAYTEKATGFDSTGNLLGLKITDTEGSYSHVYSYDFFSQLTKEDDDSYSYDSLNNRTSKNDLSYEHNSLHAVISGGLSYDARGNRITSNTTRYSYDALDRLIAVEIDSNRYLYSYDGFNRRVQKEHQIQTAFGWQSCTTTQYIYSFDNEIGATDSSGTITQFRVLAEGLGAEIGAAIALELNGNTYIPLHNRQGSVTALLDLQGNVIEHYRYDAFGNQTGGTASPINPWRFASKRHDSETGLINFGRRYYDPELGKWLTQDPLGLRAGPNLYAYCLNNPLTKCDPYGLLETDDNRGIVDRVRDWVSSAGRTIRDSFCKVGEKIAHHMPHFGSYNNSIENKLRGYRGAAPKIDKPAGLYKVYSGTMTSKGTVSHANANGLLCDFDDAVENLDAVKAAYIAKTGSHPDMYILYSPSEGFCMDFGRAFCNMFGIQTSNIDPIAQGMAELANEAKQKGGHTVLNPHSNGGQTTFLASRQLEAEQLERIHVESIASTKMFHVRQGFGAASNYGGWSDFTSLVSDPFGVLYHGVMKQGCVQMVGHPFHFPCSQHAYISREYLEILREIAAKHG
ncbi:MAG: hypothetical protein JSS12_06645 [Verrucomicrobia bacterium]|nr:hypothetical protein [Verrucomicrobiota bacterium]